MISKKHKKFCTNWNYIEHFLVLASTITGCISISAFASLFGVSIRIMSSAISFKSFAVTTEIKKCKSILKKKKRNKHDKIAFLANLH